MNSAIHYSDFVILGGNCISENMHVDFIDCFKLLLDTNFEILKNDLCESFGLKKIPKRSEEQIVEGVLSTSPKEKDKKIKDKNYYICHVCCMYNTVVKIFDRDLFDAISDKKTPLIVRQNYEYILMHFILDFWNLSSIYSREFGIEIKHKCYAQAYEHFMPIHQFLRQTLYGQVSLDSFSDMHTNSGILVIRQLIEIRIRRAFGIYSYVDSNGNLKPINMSTIFELLKKYNDDIEFPFKLSNIERIYRWSNMYVHSGLYELSWVPYFLELFLRPLSFGKEPNINGYNINSGIRTSKEIVEKIHEELLQQNSNYKIYGGKCECIFK